MISDSQLKVLGCSGGFGKGHHTTSFLINDSLLIDCGTGVGQLANSELKKINHIFITHCHLDHIVSLPFLLDAAGIKRYQPLQVYANRTTIDAIKNHIMNNLIWPDFTKIPSPDQPSVVFVDSLAQSTWHLEGLKIRAHKVPHVVDALSYVVESSSGAIAFSGDTGYSEEFIQFLNTIPKLKHLLIETSFPDEEIELARVSQHLCPSLLIAMLKSLDAQPQIHLSHLKPGYEKKILDQVARVSKRRISNLKNNQNLLF